VRYNLPLVVAALLFFAYLVWSMRPVLSRRRSLRPKRGALRAARQLVTAAKSPQERALALCDAGDACAYALGRTTGAVGYFLRAMRTDPSSVVVVDRAAQALARRPYALEALLWRRLGSERWEGERREPALAALRHLAALYAGPIRNATRARALEHALTSLTKEAQPPPAA